MTDADRYEEYRRGVDDYNARKRRDMATEILWGIIVCIGLISLVVWTLGCSPVPYSPPTPGPTPWTPTPPPQPVPPPQPPPQPIPPPNPQPPSSSGGVTEADVSAIEDDTVGADGVVRVGTSEANMILRLGQPYQKSTAAGFTVYRYVLLDAAGRDSGHVVAFWVKDGHVNHRTRL